MYLYIYTYLNISKYIYIYIYITKKFNNQKTKNLKQASIEQNWGGNSDQVLAELIHEMQQVPLATENLKRHFDQMLKLS